MHLAHSDLDKGHPHPLGAVPLTFRTPSDGDLHIF
jgi:hypothetical protein